MEFSELITKRQSCRKFSDREVERDLLLKIVDMARLAPSACNSQPWRVYITNTPEKNEQMRRCLQNNGRNSFLDGAKAFIAVYQTDNIKLNPGTELKFSSTHFAEYDVGEFIAYLTLAAKDNGLDSCIIGWVNNEQLNETFSLSGKCDLVVALGYAENGTVRVKTRKSLKEVIEE